PQPQMQLEVLATCQGLVDDGVLEHDTAAGSRPDWIGRHVASPPGGAAGGGAARGVEHSDRRGFAGSVGPQEAEGLPGSDGEADAADGMDVTGIHLFELDGLDGRSFGERSHASPSFFSKTLIKWPSGSRSIIERR